MFSLQQSDELVFHQIPSSIFIRNQQDLFKDLHDHVTIEGNTNLQASKATKRRRDDSSSSKPNSANTDGGVEDSMDQHIQRKLVHREIERKRRKDIAKLYASLRGLLPSEFVKGKRSISDHIQEAVNYIEQMQENIKVLSVKRDQLKKFVDMSATESLLDSPPNTVLISSCNGRSVEILINSCLIEDGFPFSRVLKALVKEGIDVINCTSTKINKRLLHSIQSEASDSTSTDLSVLQQRITVIANDRSKLR